MGAEAVTESTTKCIPGPVQRIRQYKIFRQNMNGLQKRCEYQTEWFECHAKMTVHSVLENKMIMKSYTDKEK